FNLSVGKKLARRESGVKDYLDFPPKRVESIALYRIQDTDKRLIVRQSVVRHVDDVDGIVVRDQLLLCLRREFLEIDREEGAIIVCRHASGAAILASCRLLRLNCDLRGEGILTRGD